MTIMKRLAKIIAILIFFAGIVGALIFYWKNLRGIGPAIRPPSEKVSDVIMRSQGAFVLPSHFSISIFAEGIPGARVIKKDHFGNMWVSQTKEGTISLVEVENGKAKNVSVVLRNLKNPHGLAFDPQDPQMLYFAEENKISRVRVYSDGDLEKIADLPSGGGGHVTRTIGFGPDDRLYVSIGSTCNVCYEKDGRNAKIFSMNRNGGDMREEARGLRNAVFFTWSYINGSMWITEMGRDLLGDDTPPDEINIIHHGTEPPIGSGARNFGWPICYGKNIHDTDFDKNTYIRNPCMEPFEIPSYIDIPAHSAPLGLAFVPEEGWPEEYWYNLLVAYHGSWNRSVPTGYKIARIKLDDKGNYQGVEDFITGWLKSDNTTLGRPVDILIEPGGVMYISDDKAGVIYKVTYNPKEEGMGTPDTSDLIRVYSPRPNQVVKSPLTIKGEARGYWFFEASFPAYLYDANGAEIVGMPIQAGFDPKTGEINWMTTDFVPFEAEMIFYTPSTDTGMLVLEKDNPSGLPEYADEIRIPVRFK